MSSYPDHLHNCMRAAQRRIDRALDTVEAQRRAYYNDPTDHTRMKLEKAEAELEAAMGEKEEIAAAFKEAEGWATQVISRLGRG